MRYYPTGLDRDSHISGVRPGGGAPVSHDVNKRRDNLPDHVFASIREEVLMEERMRHVNAEARARAQLIQASGTHGKRMAGGSVGDDRRELERVSSAEAVNARHRALLELYSLEMEGWKEELAERGLSIEM
ncbi:uncharacterized protein TEOVI_000396400 [Trypanosoma equiperdum]|uniref:Uncharacterized protein n=3 Tax=Trypanozoon TaxID=39700 RepID=Q38BT0_TRYB2|nr:hypothetical protein, conserved [Trypanosoma brucei brucei TREU927]EAN77740.1 hypothetical protein, conserved [Trypanosoma brucei brucei TREU927]RHW69546.1 hypothetical protein DPX39_100038000 [Trypanosoma brucei equiperdum]SCU72388.1 hypothetical protein, conserved [Trypanosoma equiperdum]